MEVKFLTSAIVVLMSITATSALALDNVEVNGFLTAGMVKSDSISSSDGLITNEVGFANDSRVGIQITAELQSDISVTAQLLGRGSQDNFNTRFNWGFVKFHLNDNVDIRTGKLKFATAIVSDYQEVGYAYPWIRPPQEFYDLNPLSTISGVDVLFQGRVGLLDLLIQPFIGANSREEGTLSQEALAGFAAENPSLGLRPGQVVPLEFSTQDMVGINFSIGTDAFTFRAGYLETKVDVQLPPLLIIDDDKVTAANAGFTVDWANIVAYAEYIEIETVGQTNTTFPNQKAGYATLGYRIGKFLPHITYGKLDDNNNPLNTDPANPQFGIPQKQESWTLGLRYELGLGAALKVEARQAKPLDGTRGQFIESAEEINIYSVAVDVVF